jgi:alpha-L-fucosidase
MLEIYHKTVGYGAQLVLGLAPDDRGLIPKVDVARLNEFGDTIRRVYGRNLVRVAGGTGTASAAIDGDPDTFWSAPAGSHQAQIEVVFSKPVSFDRTVTMEWLNAGQLVHRYRIEGFSGGSWKTLYSGTTIGHKKIDRFSRITASRVRLNILMAAAAPHIREFQLCDGADQRPLR